MTEKKRSRKQITVAYGTDFETVLDSFDKNVKKFPKLQDRTKTIKWLIKKFNDKYDNYEPLDEPDFKYSDLLPEQPEPIAG